MRLFFNALRSASADIGAHASLVDSKDDAAAAFYEHHGFVCFANQPRVLFLPLATLKRFHGSGRSTEFDAAMSRLRAGRYEIDLSTPCVMGILNVTADSFYDGGRLDRHGALAHARAG